MFQTLSARLTGWCMSCTAWRSPSTGSGWARRLGWWRGRKSKIVRAPPLVCPEWSRMGQPMAHPSNSPRKCQNICAIIRLWGQTPHSTGPCGVHPFPLTKGRGRGLGFASPAIGKQTLLTKRIERYLDNSTLFDRENRKTNRACLTIRFLNMNLLLQARPERKPLSSNKNAAKNENESTL